MLASEMVTAVTNQGGFDTSGANVSAATILSWLNAKYRELCARSKFTKAAITISTSAGVATYAIPDNVSELLALRVDGSREWLRIGADEMWSLRSSGSLLPADKPGAYAPAFSADASSQSIELYPTPTAAGSINALAVLLPSALTTSPDVSPVVPADFHEALVAGAIALGLERTDGRFDVSAGHNAQFESAVALLKRRAVTRVGQGPVQLKVAGVHF